MRIANRLTVSGEDIHDAGSNPAKPKHGSIKNI